MFTYRYVYIWYFQLLYEMLCFVLFFSFRFWVMWLWSTCPALCRLPKWTSGMKRTGWASRSVMVLKKVVSDFLGALITPTPPSFPSHQRMQQKQSWTLCWPPGRCTWCHGHQGAPRHTLFLVFFFFSCSNLLISCGKVFSPRLWFSSRLPGKQNNTKYKNITEQICWARVPMSGFILSFTAHKWPPEGEVTSELNSFTRHALSWRQRGSSCS